MYILDGETLKGSVCAAMKSNSDKTLICHRRLGHLSDKGLQELHKQNFLCGDNVTKMDFYEYCILGKQHRASFRPAIHNTKRIMEDVH